MCRVRVELLVALASALALLAPVEGAVFTGRLVSTTNSFFDNNSTAVIQLRVPTTLITYGVCVDVIPIHSEFDAKLLTACTGSATSMPFHLALPGVYHVHLRMRTPGGPFTLWDERPLVITILSGNLSMAQTMICVMLTSGVLMTLAVFVWTPLYLMRMPFVPLDVFER